VEVIELDVSDRVDFGSGDSRRERVAGRLPAVVYKKGSDAKSLTMDSHSFALKARGRPHSQLFKFNGSKVLDGLMGLVKSVQVEPIKGTLMHVEFMAVTSEQMVEVSIPVILQGTPDCIRQGTATINQMAYEVTVTCQATKIPAEFILDISNLEADESLHASDLKLPEGVELISVSGYTIVTAFVDKRADAAAAAATAATAGVAAKPGAAPAKPGAASAKAGAPAKAAAPTKK